MGMRELKNRFEFNDRLLKNKRINIRTWRKFMRVLIKEYKKRNV